MSILNTCVVYNDKYLYLNEDFELAGLHFLGKNNAINIKLLPLSFMKNIFDNYKRVKNYNLPDLYQKNKTLHELENQSVSKEGIEWFKRTFSANNISLGNMGIFSVMLLKFNHFHDEDGQEITEYDVNEFDYIIDLDNEHYSFKLDNGVLFSLSFKDIKSLGVRQINYLFDNFEKFIQSSLSPYDFCSQSVIVTKNESSQDTLNHLASESLMPSYYVSLNDFFYTNKYESIWFSQKKYNCFSLSHMLILKSVLHKLYSFNCNYKILNDVIRWQPCSSDNFYSGKTCFEVHFLLFKNRLSENNAHFIETFLDFITEKLNFVYFSGSSNSTSLTDIEKAISKNKDSYRTPLVKTATFDQLSDYLTSNKITLKDYKENMVSAFNYFDYSLIKNVIEHNECSDNAYFQFLFNIICLEDVHNFEKYADAFINKFNKLKRKKIIAQQIMSFYDQRVIIHDILDVIIPETAEARKQNSIAFEKVLKNNNLIQTMRKHLDSYDKKRLAL